MRIQILIAMLISILVAIVMMGCGGSSGNTKTYETTAPAEKAGTSITVTSGGDAELNYSYANDGSVIVGSDNGDVNLVLGEGYITNTNAVPDDEEGGFVNAAGEPTCGSGDPDGCPDGYFYCPIEGKCIPA